MSEKDSKFLMGHEFMLPALFKLIVEVGLAQQNSHQKIDVLMIT